MFPTKALSQDQSPSLNSLIGELGRDRHSLTDDDDTPPSVRRTLRERGHVVLTNSWMLHAGILPHHARWADLFAHPEYVLIGAQSRGVRRADRAHFDLILQPEHRSRVFRVGSRQLAKPDETRDRERP